ncbi:MAG: WecB/TagA/CpsF family glycosyltransferase, partial [Clostridiales bacterium]|nr:WecB/TagA/CpsF family glycosyltransferase [Clostridiales bacterium]
ITMDEATKKVLGFMQSKKSHSIFTPNAEMAMAAVGDSNYMAVLNSADLLIPDGSGVVLGAKFLGTPLREKVAGIELVLSLLSSGQELSVFIYGGKPGIAEKAAENINGKFPSIDICGIIHGYHDASFEDSHIEIIKNASPDLLFVALGFPRQEEWIHRNIDRIRHCSAIGCGGTIDYLAGVVKRTPKFMIKLNLEWLDRLIRQPKRLGRMLRIPVFLFRCLKERLF